MRRAMIIGASAGLGRHLALALQRRDWEVWGVSRRAVAAGSTFKHVLADLADWADVERLKRLLATDGPDLVVFNAVRYADAPPGREQPDGLEALFRINALAPYVLLYDYVNAARDTLRTLVIVNSDAIYHASPQSGVYAASKAALRVLTSALAHAAKSKNAAAATLLLGPLADEKKRAEFKRIAEKRGLEEAAVTKIFLERSNPAFVIDDLITYDQCVESVLYIVSLGRSANGMLCKLDGGSSGSLI